MRSINKPQKKLAETQKKITKIDTEIAKTIQEITEFRKEIGTVDTQITEVNTQITGIDRQIANLTSNENAFTFLWMAATDGNVMVVNGLLDANTNPNHKTSDGYTALHLATLNNHVEVVIY